DQWVPYGERQNYLLEADVGVCLHQDIAETRLAFRTRLIDYIWTGLPMVVSGGDSLSETVDQFQLGKVVPCGDAAQIARALIEVLSLADPRESYRERFEAVRSQLNWKRAVEPLLRFLSNPQRAPDLSH
ncbi:MAG: glycosyltransferase family 1 protein, partial [Chloroflexota bacterium]|nr:glycosyltransferase family 1 protein [Chloroflexota bacterium]